MNRFEVRPFQDELEIHDDEELVTVIEGNRGGWKEAVVALPDREDETYRCGVELEGGGTNGRGGNTCGREVDSPDETCWQHSDGNE